MTTHPPLHRTRSYGSPSGPQLKPGSLSTGGAATRLILPWALLVASGVATFGATSAIDLSETILWGAIGLSLYLASLFAFLFARRRYLGLFEGQLGAWSLAYAILAFGIATATITQPQIGASAIVDKEMIPSALVLLAISFTTWSIGYGVGRARIIQAPFRWGRAAIVSGLSSNVRRPGILIAIFATSVAADVLKTYLTGQYGYVGDSSLVTVETAAWYTQPLFIVSGLKFVALFGLSARVFVNRLDSFARYLLPAFTFAVAMGLLTGMKEAFVTIVISVGVPYLLGHSRGRLFAIAGAVLVFVFVVTPTVNGFRQDIRGSSGTLDVASALSLGVGKIFSPDGYLSSAGNAPTQGSTLERVRLIDNLALIMDKTPDRIPYRSIGEVVSAPITGFVPRLLWPDKPVRLSGYEFYKLYYEGPSQSSSAITLQGSLYLYGGAWVLFVGMFLVGIALRALDESLDVQNGLHGALFLVLIFSIVVKQEMDVASFLATLATLIVSWILGVHLVFRRVGVTERPNALFGQKA